MSLNSSLDAWGTEDVVEEFGKRALFGVPAAHFSPGSGGGSGSGSGSGNGNGDGDGEGPSAPVASAAPALPPSCATNFTTSFAAGKRMTFNEIRERAEAEARTKERNRLLQRKLMQAEARDRLVATASAASKIGEDARAGTRTERRKERVKQDKAKVKAKKKSASTSTSTSKRKQQRAGSNPNAAAITPPVPRRARGRTTPIVGIKIRDPLSASKRRQQTVIQQNTPGCVEAPATAPTPISPSGATSASPSSTSSSSSSAEEGPKLGGVFKAHFDKMKRMEIEVEQCTTRATRAEGRAIRAERALSSSQQERDALSEDNFRLQAALKECKGRLSREASERAETQRKFTVESRMLQTLQVELRSVCGQLAELRNERDGAVSNLGLEK